MNTCPPPLVEALSLLAAQIEQVMPGSGWQRIELPVNPDTELLAWLEAGEGIRVYWAERDGDLELAGMGTAFRISLNQLADFSESLPAMQGIIAQCPDARFVGGLAFSSRQDDHWPGFGGGEMVLPRFELRRRNGQLTLASHICLSDDRQGCREREQLAHDARALTADSSLSEGLPQATILADTPDLEHWRQQVEQALRLLESGELNKVVLSREQTLSLESELSPGAMVNALYEKNPGTYRFAFWTDEGHCFFGASPERLYRRLGRQLDSEALAGTAPRGGSDRQDFRLAATLLGDDKNRRENALVHKAICQELEYCTEHLTLSPEVSLIKLQSVQHLKQVIHAELKQGVDDDVLLSSLHPTPAVGGAPRQQALSVIDDLETYQRGWYAGPFGCIGQDMAEFAVAIRSARLQGQELSLFSGAGLVPGSCADAEWAELGSKLRTIHAMLKVEL